MEMEHILIPYNFLLVLNMDIILITAMDPATNLVMDLEIVLAVITAMTDL